MFRSASLVLADNSESEYEFVNTFFGQHSSLDVTRSTHSNSLLAGGSSIGAGSDRGDNDSVLGSEAGNSSFEGGLSRDERKERLRRTVIDGLWKSIMEPAQEYVANFVGALLEPTPPTPTALLAMIRLNEALLASATEEGHECSPLEAHLSATRLDLYAVQSKVMQAQIESVKRINGSLPSGGVFGGKGTGTNVKDSVVEVVVLRYVQMFNAFVELSDDGAGGEDNLFASLLRLRHEVDKLLTYQAGKVTEPDKQRAFLATHYEQVLRSLGAGLSRHARSQAEAAHYAELLRKATMS